MKRVLGIKCTLKSSNGQRAMREVLRQIQAKCDRDYRRIAGLVLCVRPRRWTDGTIGQCVPGGELDDDAARTVYLSERRPFAGIVATLAHEFGHVCSTFADCERRNMPDSEWASELTADWFAYKWGFGRLIARERRGRLVRHHGPQPGQWFEINDQRYHVSRRFRVRLLQ